MNTVEPFSPDHAVARIARQLVPPTEMHGERPASRADMGLLATLRRFDPITHGRQCLFATEQVLHHAGVHPGDSDEHRRWAVIVHCLALARGALSGRPPGEALASLQYGEGRLRQLLQADAALLMQLLPRLARRLSAHRLSIDWWPLAKLLLNADRQETQADEARAWIARSFIQATTRAAASGHPPLDNPSADHNPGSST